MQHYSADVVVVGAGLSGLQTARLVQEAGLSCIVLEAIDRVGGKTLSVRSAESNSGYNDLGAAWINDTTQSNMYALLNELKLTAVVQRVKGKDVMLSKDGQVTLVPHGDLPPVCWPSSFRITEEESLTPFQFHREKKKTLLYWLRSLPQ